MIISQKAQDSIKGNIRLKNLLAAELNCGTATIDRWIKTKDMISLTGAAAIHIGLIKEETGLKEKEILVNGQEPVQN